MCFIPGDAVEVSLIVQNETNNIGQSSRDSLQNFNASLNGGPRMIDSDLHNQALTDSRQERSLGITIISISALFIICQSVKMVPTIYEIFLCNRKPQKLHSGESHPTFCETTDVIDRFIRYIIPPSL